MLIEGGCSGDRGAVEAGFRGPVGGAEHGSAGQAEGSDRRYVRSRWPSKLNMFADYIWARLAVVPGWITATVMLSELRAWGYTGSHSILRAFMAGLRPVEPPNQFAPPLSMMASSDSISVAMTLSNRFASTLNPSASASMYCAPSASYAANVWLDWSRSKLFLDPKICASKDDEASADKMNFVVHSIGALVSESR